MGTKAIPELEKLWKTGTDSRMRARAFWLLVKCTGSDPSKYFFEALHDSNPDIRILALRASRELKGDVAGAVKQLSADLNKQVLREAAIALRHLNAPGTDALWTTLAVAHNGADRWYLEALGIGADRHWDAFFKAYLGVTHDPTATPASRDIVWRSRTDLALPYLASLAANNNVPIQDRLRYFRAFDFHPGNAKSPYLLKMLSENTAHDMTLNKLVLHALDQKTVEKSALAKKALQEVIVTVRGTREYLDLVNRYRITAEKPQLLEMAVEKSREETGRDAAGLLLDLGGKEMVKKVWAGKDTIKSANLMHATGGVGSKISIDLLQEFAFSERNVLPMRKIAASNIGRSWGGEERVLNILKNKQVPKILIPDVVSGVSQAWRGSVRTEAASYMETGTGIINRKVPGINELRAMNGNAANGKTVFMNTCALCHKVNEEGYDFGPALTEIGAKLSKDGLWEAILHPSAGISFGYEGWNISMKDGTRYAGIISSKTETDIELKLPGGVKKQIKTGDVISLTQMPSSMMPEGLYKPMKDQDIADLLEYLSGLVKR